jgi:hypothetical protein
VTCHRIALGQAQRILYRVDERPAQLKQLTTGPPGKDEPRQRSAGPRPTLSQLKRAECSPGAHRH